MRGIVLCSSLEAGGAQRAAIKLNFQLNKLNYNSENWFLTEKQNVYTENNITVIYSKKVTTPFGLVSAIVKLYKKIRQEKPQYVISFLHYSNIIGLTVAFLCGVKIRIASHRNVCKYDMNRTVRLLDLFCAWTGIYTGITAVSESTKKSFGHYPKRIYNKVRVVNNGLEFIPSNLSKKEARRLFKLPLEVNLLGNIGRMSKQKNQKFLLQILENLSESHLVILGDGPLKEELVVQSKIFNVQDRVHFISQLESSQIPDFLKALDIFVMPSINEGLSNALIEALCSGTPVVSSNIDSQRDVIVSPVHGECGILLNNNDTSLWVETIKELQKSPKRMLDLSLKGIERGHDFSMDRMVEGFIQSISE